MIDGKELIWVDKEFAEKFKQAETEQAKTGEKIKVFDEYLQSVQESARQEFEANLDILEEDAAIFSGLMLKVKQAFGKAKDEQLDASYKLWEKFENELPNIEEKIKQITDLVQPVEEKINTLNNLLSKIQTFNIENFVEAVGKISGMFGKDAKMIKFLVNNFKEA